jgi:hypothetical protein
MRIRCPRINMNPWSGGGRREPSGQPPGRIIRQLRSGGLRLELEGLPMKGIIGTAAINFLSAARLPATDDPTHGLHRPADRQTSSFQFSNHNFAGLKIRRDRHRHDIRPCVIV